MAGLWGAEHTSAFEQIKSHLVHALKLSHPKEGYEMCLFSDSSDTHWGSVLTQVPKSQLSMEIEEQVHEPLSFLSGSFSSHSKNWSIVEKEAFAVVESMIRLEYLTSMKEVYVFTDHSNLLYIFDPYGRNPGISKQAANKLIRWALKLSAYRYVIEYVEGTRNVWADMLTRWAVKSRHNTRVARLASVMYAPISASEKKEFEWPSRADLIKSQKSSRDKYPKKFNMNNGMIQNDQGVVWIPQKDDLLKIRILIAAHTGLGGHRKKTTTLRSLKDHFAWETLDVDVETFCESCIHCLATDSGEWRDAE